MPNPLKIQPFLTVIPGRTPKQKLHANIGHAKLAIRNAMPYSPTKGCYYDMQMFEWKDGAWALLHDFPSGTTTLELPWVKK